MPRGSCHESIKPIAWLIGRWRTITPGEGFYPTIKPFTYCDEITFESMGQPLLNYMANSSNPTTGRPIHMERGFLRIKPQTNQVAFMIAHNLGATTVEEGEVCNHELKCKSTHVSNMSFVKLPRTLGLERTIRINSDGNLEVCLSLETEKTEMSPHVQALYEQF